MVVRSATCALPDSGAWLVASTTDALVWAPSLEGNLAGTTQQPPRSDKGNQESKKPIPLDPDHCAGEAAGGGLDIEVHAAFGTLGIDDVDLDTALAL